MPLLRASQIPSQHGAARAEQPRHAGAVRAGLAALGAVLVLCGIWLLTADVMSKGLSKFASRSEPAQSASGGADAAALAAERSELVRAARLAPHDARIWLRLAAALSRAGGPPDAIAAALKMSYYTGSNEVTLMPSRIALAAQPNLGDAELRILLENEIRTIAQQASLRPVLAQAYRSASADAQRSLREVVGTIDARLASEMQSAQ